MKKNLLNSIKNLKDMTSILGDCIVSKGVSYFNDNSCQFLEFENPNPILYVAK